MPQPKLIVMTRSPSWCAVVERNFPATQRSRVLDAQSLHAESLNSFGAAAIVEVPANNPEEFCLQLLPLINNSSQLKLFAVGDRSLLTWRPLLAASGFAAWYWSLLQAIDLAAAVERHHQSVSPREQSIESRVWQELPWPTATQTPQA